MAVVIDSGPVEAEDLLRHVPQEKWRELMLARRRFCEIKLSHDCRCLVQFIADAEAMFAPLGFKSAEDMVRRGYEIEPAEINVAVEWLRLNPPTEPLPLDQAVKLGSHGVNQHTVGGSNTTSSSVGRGSKYILARLDRDGHTALAEKVRAGEMSANAAAIEAGFRKQTTPLDNLHRAWRKASAEQRTAFLDAIGLRDLLDLSDGYKPDPNQLSLP